jgi:hypothetical protein
MQVIEQHLPAEGTADRQLEAFGKVWKSATASRSQRVPPRMIIGRSAFSRRR